MTPDRRTLVDLTIGTDAEIVWAYLTAPWLAPRWFGTGGPDSPALVTRLLNNARVDAEERLLAWPDGTTVSVVPGPEEHVSTVLAIRPARDPHRHVDDPDDEVDELWVTALHQLRFALELHPGVERRVWSAVGLDAGPARDRLLDRVGLHGLRGLAVGAHLEAVTPDGRKVGGTVDFHTRWQVGVRLVGGGGAYLLVRERSAALHPPDGVLDLTLSTYGLDDAQLAAVGARWDAWWHPTSRPLAGSSHR